MSLEFGSERACAPPALSALNLGRLLRVVLPVKRDRSPDNPKVPATTLPACLKASGLALHFLRKGLPRRSWACPAALRGVLKGEGASATTEPKFNQSSETRSKNDLLSLVSYIQTDTTTYVEECELTCIRLLF